MTRTLAELEWPVRTERLLLRPSDPDDAPANYRLRSLPAVAEWAGSIPVDLPSWQVRFGDPSLAPYLVTVEHDGDVVGELMLHTRDAWAQAEVAERGVGVEAELGWMIDPALQGRGLATEAARALLAIAFTGVGVRRVVASTPTVNVASWRVMEKLGLRLERELRSASLHRDRGWLDVREYALLAEEWS